MYVIYNGKNGIIKKCKIVIYNWENKIITKKDDSNVSYRNIETRLHAKNTPFVVLDTLYKNGLMI